MTKATMIAGYLPKEAKDCFIAGGSITSIYTNKPINDIDVYPKTEAAFEDLVHLMFESGYFCADVSERAVTFVQGDDIPIQIMHFDTFETAEKIFECFDFTVCMGAYDVDTKKFVLHDDFLEDCCQRVLRFNPKTRFPYASAWRVNKYKERGYTIGKFENFKILAACALKPINSWDELVDQIGGIYGEAVRVPEDTPFSIENMFAAMNDRLTFPTKSPVGSAEEVILAVGKREIEYYQLNGKFYARVYTDSDDYEPVPCRPVNGKMVDVGEIFKDRVFFKKVYRNGDELVSMYKPTFKYVVGEYVQSGDPYIYAKQTIKQAFDYCTYRDKAVVIELKPGCVSDIIMDEGGVVRLKRALVTRVVDPSENVPGQPAQIKPAPKTIPLID